MRWKQKDTESSLNKSKVNNMWKPPAIDFREEHRLLNRNRRNNKRNVASLRNVLHNVGLDKETKV